jgi:histone deacetylase 1/2
MVNQHSMATRGKVQFCQPATLLSTVVSPISKTYRSALADPNWCAAMEDEYAALLSNNTWNLVPRPQAPMWPQASGFFGLSTMLRGFTQRPGVDYDETFNPVVKPATVCTTLFLALSHNWPVHQLDVKNAFLHGTLSETVYCCQPTGFVDPAAPNLVCSLNKSLYGLK